MLTIVSIVLADDHIFKAKHFCSVRHFLLLGVMVSKCANRVSRPRLGTAKISTESLVLFFPLFRRSEPIINRCQFMLPGNWFRIAAFACSFFAASVNIAAIWRSVSKLLFQTSLLSSSVCSTLPRPSFGDPCPVGKLLSGQAGDDDDREATCSATVRISVVADGIQQPVTFECDGKSWVQV